MKRTQRRAAAMLALLILAASLATAASSRAQPQYKLYLPLVQRSHLITNVLDGAHVARTITLLGDYPPGVSDDLWIFVEPENNRFYPQAQIDDCQAKRTPNIGGHWEVRAGLGQPENTGEQFRILVTATKPVTSQLILDTLGQWCQAQDYPGWEALPKGIQVLDSITVTRTAKLWGDPPAISNTQLPGAVKITDPISGTEVPVTYTIRGTYSSDTTADIWVLIFPTNGRWYPQSFDACAGIHTQASNGQWQVLASFGGPQGERFDVIVVTANPQASAFFDATQRAWCTAGDAPGFLTLALPLGIDQKDWIKLVKK
jgi:hypothetical protein